MGKTEEKIKKKEAKARLKTAKAEAEAAAKQAKTDSAKSSAFLRSADGRISVSINKHSGGSSDLIVKGLSEEQLNKIIPGINKEILITLTAEKKPLKASFMRFIREGAWETFIKVLAGLIVGILLIKLGLK